MADILKFKEWRIPSVLGNERAVLNEVASFLKTCFPNETRIEDMLTSVAEACLNAMEHGNRLIPELPVILQLMVDQEKYAFRICDFGDQPPIQTQERTLEERWEADQPRGWGLYLIRRLADRVEFGKCDNQVHLDMIFMRNEGDAHEQQ